MGSLLHPAGSQPPAVYWLRRAVVLVIVGALIAGFVWLVTRASSGEADDVVTTAATPVSVTSPSASAAASDTVSAAPSVSASAGASSTASAKAAAVTDCGADDVQVTLAGFQRVKQDANQAFKLSISNDSNTKCVLDVTSASFDLTVTSGSDRIWTTADCAKWVPTKKLTLKPQQGYEFGINWTLDRSKSNCKLTGATLGVGTYVAKASYAQNATARLVMNIIKK